MSGHGSLQGFPADTSPEALRVQFEILRRLTPAQRIALVDDLTKLARGLAMAGLRQRHPEASEARIEELFFEMTLGPELAQSVLADRRVKRGR